MIDGWASQVKNFFYFFCFFIVLVCRFLWLKAQTYKREKNTYWEVELKVFNMTKHLSRRRGKCANLLIHSHLLTDIRWKLRKFFTPLSATPIFTSEIVSKLSVSTNRSIEAFGNKSEVLCSLLSIHRQKKIVTFHRLQYINWMVLYWQFGHVLWSKFVVWEV